MTALVRLSDTTTVNPTCVTEVIANYEYGSVTVRMSDGREHHLQNDFSRTTSETRDRIVKALEGASHG